MKRFLIVALACVFAAVSAAAYDGNDWPEQSKVVKIKSSADGEIQLARFYAAKSKAPRPLVVRLHAWSAHYDVPERPLFEQLIKEDVNFISPDFRGPNERPEAMCSDLVLSDINDAIDYAIAHGNVDENEILGQAEDPDKAYIEQIMPDKIRYNMKWINNQGVTEYFKIIFMTFFKIVK